MNATATLQSIAAARVRVKRSRVRFLMGAGMTHAEACEIVRDCHESPGKHRYLTYGTTRHETARALMEYRTRIRADGPGELAMILARVTLEVRAGLRARRADLRGIR